MRRWAALFTLIAAITGTPLRQAEAASDLSRTLAGLFQSADIESPDGGVGDDSGVGTLTAAHGSLAADALLYADPLFLPPPVASGLSRFEAECLRERVWWPQDPPSLRFAWLQSFLF